MTAIPTWNVLSRVRVELDHMCRVCNGNDRLVELKDRFRYAAAPAGRAIVAGQIAARLRGQADHLSVSWLARTVTLRPSPQVLRGLAADWDTQAAELWAAAAKENTP